MRQRAIELLEELKRLKAGEKRLRTLLRDPENEGEDDWYMYVPPWFNGGLDIEKTEKELVWTQASRFDFHKGDTIYDTRMGYKEWKVALKHIGCCFQVDFAVQAELALDGKERFPGRVGFTKFHPNSDRTGLLEVGSHEVTQDEFIRILIGGM